MLEQSTNNNNSNRKLLSVLTCFFGHNQLNNRPQKRKKTQRSSKKMSQNEIPSDYVTPNVIYSCFCVAAVCWPVPHMDMWVSGQGQSKGLWVLLNQGSSVKYHKCLDGSEIRQVETSVHVENPQRGCGDWCHVVPKTTLIILDPEPLLHK